MLSRVVPRDGRSRAYVDGRLATAAALAELGAGLVDLHGQHAHQSLLAPAAQRDALDRFGGVDLAPLRGRRERDRRASTPRSAALGGDDRARARELDLLRFQVDELDARAASPTRRGRALEAEEDAAGRRRRPPGGGGRRPWPRWPTTAARADAVGRRRRRPSPAGAPFAAIEERLRALAAELADVAAELRRLAEAHRRRPRAPGRRSAPAASSCTSCAASTATTLAEVHRLRGRAPRAGSPSSTRHDERAARARRRAGRGRRRPRRRRPKRSARRSPARGRPGWPTPCRPTSASWPWPSARSRSPSASDPGDEVAFLPGRQPGRRPPPLAKVASGGELARAMLALRLVLAGTAAGPTLVFDEVDAGVGGEAALAVGRALAAPRRATTRCWWSPTSPGGGVRRRTRSSWPRPTTARSTTATAPDAVDGDDAGRRAVPDAVGHAGAARPPEAHAAELLGRRGRGGPR